MALTEERFDIHRMFLHKRQFLISGNSDGVSSNWKKLELSGGRTLSHCPELEIIAAQDREAKTWYIIGNAFQADPDLPEPRKHLGNLLSADVPAATYTWAGRWALVGPEIVVPDASGLLGLFYFRAPCKTVVISSSLAVIRDLFPELEVNKRKLGRYGMNWFPPPSTNLSKVIKLLPDQILVTSTGTTLYLKRICPEPVARMASDERAQLVFSYLKHIFRQLAEKRSKISIALTAGQDSRVSLAVALVAGLNVDAVTMVYPGMAKADRIIPKTICAKIGLKHSCLEPGTFDEHKQRLYDHHTLFNSDDWDRFFFSCGILNGLAEDAWLVRSGCWEIGRNFYYRKLRGISWQEAKENPANIVWRFQNFGSLDSTAVQLRRWCAWRAIHPELIDWKDLFYRDQRLGGWLSAIEQSLDLLRGRSIQPANCSAIFDLLLSEQEHMRSAGKLQSKIVELTRTGLDVFPVNPPLDKINPKYVRRLREWMATLIGESRNMVRL